MKNKITASKTRKKRKPMTAEQKVAASERLEKARAARVAKNPDYGKSSIHESLRDLSAEHPLHPNKVKVWIKTQTELASSERAQVKQKTKGALARQLIHEGYVRNLKTYLRNGDYLDIFYGEHQEKKIRSRCYALSYHWEGPNKGKPQRSVGTFYPDLCMVWESGMSE